VSVSAVRARNHPGAVAAVWAWRTFVALLTSWPFASLVRAAYGSDPRGDAPLWTPGSYPLLDFFWRDAHGVAAAGHGAGLALLVGMVAGLVPMAALMVALVWPATEGGRAGFVRSMDGALRAFPRLALVAVAAELGQGLVAGAGYFLWELVEGWTHAGLGEARAQQFACVIALPFAAAALAIAVVHDLARAAVVRFRARPIEAIVLGVQTMWRSPAKIGWSWGWRWIALLACVAVGGAVADRLVGRGGWTLAGLAMLHQGIIGAGVTLRASWLARALRCVRSPPYFAVSDR
jgi:hypothetical protein